MEEQIDVTLVYDGEIYHEKLFENWSVSTSFSLCNLKWFKFYYRYWNFDVRTPFYYFRNEVEYWPDFCELTADDDPFPGKLYKLGAHCNNVEIEDLNTLIKDLPEKTLSFYDILTVSAEIVLYLVVNGKRIKHSKRQYTTMDFKNSYDQYLLSCAYPRLNEIETFYNVKDLQWVDTQLYYVKKKDRYICYNTIEVKKAIPYILTDVPLHVFLYILKFIY
tara:strand:+ start:385 stop:1041 length:657 start_codon:yes stop_codon:yes gene_type:complete